MPRQIIDDHGIAGYRAQSAEKSQRPLPREMVQKQVASDEVKASFTERQRHSVRDHRMKPFGNGTAHLKMAQAAVENEELRFDTPMAQFPAQAPGQASVSGSDVEDPQAAPARPAEVASKQAQAARHSAQIPVNAPQIVQVSLNLIRLQKTEIEQLHRSNPAHEASALK